MPLDYSSLAVNTRHLRIDYGAAGDLNIEYRPQAITEKRLREINILADKSVTDFSDNAHALNSLLCNIIHAWDLTLHGEPVPLTDDGLGDLDLEFRASVLQAVVEDMRLGEPNGMPSSAESSVPSVPARRATSKRRG